MAPLTRSVGCNLHFELAGRARVVLQVAVAEHRGAQVDEQFELLRNGAPVPVTELPVEHGGRFHVIDAPPGNYALSYQAVIVGNAEPRAVDPAAEFRYLRPSRYSESDRLAATAAASFGSLTDPAELLPAVTSWVGTRLQYLAGSSAPTDGAVDTLLAGAGVCRDFAHLTVALLRAMDVPARLVAVYAPGLFPMDFHAVAEAVVDGQWRVVDATLLAPRSTLVRISTGRDAADTAFLSSYGGYLTLTYLEITASSEGPLPTDDITELVSLS